MPESSLIPEPLESPREAPLAPCLTGQSDFHLCAAADAQTLGVSAHRQVVGPFLRLKEEASRAGFDLQILSGFRAFEKQLSIWNRKVLGDLPVLDSQAVPLDIDKLSRRDLVFAILRWSALPGASRHHWGTDLDVFDAVAKPEGYEVELIPEEVNPGGMFGPLHDWLDEQISSAAAFGFFRPYDRDRGGVAPERWHLSHEPVASVFQRRLSPELLGGAIREADMGLRDVVLENLDEIYEQFVMNVGRPPA